ncbi:hypothetical protein POX_b02142 [Penicillium oxalicum]|uniref:hypothetical protein n=1 Tax=Penicillium oxalicum TaxID=69781 RepID=UPI0020B701AD|nr:hypothetical protein POX_b02142 [Penicillium oxalicum]KAI2792106.1 hypothetical protein POX_b02142 [Penicillium oxalicum]
MLHFSAKTAPPCPSSPPLLHFLCLPSTSTIIQILTTGTSIYGASIRNFKAGLIILKDILPKAITHYGPHSAGILTTTLIDDLRPLIGYVYWCSNIAQEVAHAHGQDDH